MSARDYQVDGKHYQVLKEQPFDLIKDINANFFVGNIIKYVARHPYKNKLIDLRKIKHYIEWSIENDVNQVPEMDALKRIVRFCDSNKLLQAERGCIICMYYNEKERALDHINQLLSFRYPCNDDECLFFDKGDCKASEPKDQCSKNKTHA